MAKLPLVGLSGGIIMESNTMNVSEFAASMVRIAMNLYSVDPILKRYSDLGLQKTLQYNGLIVQWFAVQVYMSAKANKDGCSEDLLKSMGKKFGEALQQYDFSVYGDPNLKTQVLTILPQQSPAYYALLSSGGDRSLTGLSFHNDVGETFANISSRPLSTGAKRAGHDIFKYCLDRCRENFDAVRVTSD